MPGCVIDACASQLGTIKGLTVLLPFTPVPQAVENHSGQEDGKESCKSRKDGAALVFLSVRKNKCHV